MLKRMLLIVAVVAGLLAAAFGGPAWPQTAQAAGPDAQRISFPPGSTSYVLSTTLAQGDLQSYLLGISAGQTLYITENGSATVEVFDPDGNSLAGPTTAQGPWSVLIPQTGDYTVTLDGDGAVTVVFSIPPLWAGAPWPVPGHVTRISFARGATSSTFTARLQAGVPAGYLLRLGAGQQLSVTLNGNATARLSDPFGSAVQPVTSGPGAWQFPLSWTGDYRLTLQGSGAVTVTVYAPPLAPPAGTVTRIRFAPGNASTTFSANLVQGRASRYILGIAAHQTLYVQVVGDENASVSVTGPGGMAVNTVRAGRPGLWIAAARTTGDYTVAISGQGQVWVTVYVPPL